MSLTSNYFQSEEYIKRDFSKNPLYIGYDIHNLLHNVGLGSSAIPMGAIQWMHMNCTEEWGWHHFNNEAIAGFNNIEEALLFKLIWR